MRAIAFILFATLATLAAAPALADSSHVIFIGTDGTASMRDVAMLVFNQSDSELRVKTLVTSIGPDEHRMGTNVEKKKLAVAKPGKYRITARCVYSTRIVLVQEKVDLVAGKKYSVSCKGNTPRTLKLVTAEMDSPS